MARRSRKRALDPDNGLRPSPYEGEELRRRLDAFFKRPVTQDEIDAWDQVKIWLDEDRGGGRTLFPEE